MQFLMYELKMQRWFEIIVQGPEIQNVVMAIWNAGPFIRGNIFKFNTLMIPIE